MKRWKVTVEMVGLLDRRQRQTIEVQADSRHAAECLAVYVAAGIHRNFQSYEPVEAIDQDDPRFHGNGSIAA